MKTSAKTSAAAFATFVWVALAAVTSAATSIVPLSIHQLTRYSSNIVEAHAVSAYSAWNPSHTLIFTYTTFAVDRSWKGSAPAVFTLRQIGGTIGQDAVRVDGVRYFRPGDRSVLFLQSSVNGAFSLTGMVQGDFRVRRAMDGEETVSNGIIGPRTHTLDVGAHEVYSSGGFHVEELEAAVKEAMSR